MAIVGRILLIVLLLLIVLIFFVPYGVDASYRDGVLRLGLQAGPIRIGLLPKKPLTERQKAKKARKQAKKEEKRRKAEEAKAAEEPKPEPLDEKVKIPKKRELPFELNVETVLALLKMTIHAIRRFFRSFTVNFFQLHLLVASGDPYNTAMEYAAACSAVEALPALCGSVIRVRRRDIQIGSDFLSDKPQIAFRITLTLQLFLIVHMAVAFAAEFLVWFIKNRAANKAAAASERKDDNGREQVQ